MYFMAFLLILLVLHQITSLMTVLSQGDILTKAVRSPLSIQILFHLAWIVVSGVTLFRVSRRSPWANTQAVGILIGFAAHNLLWMLIWAQADYDRGRGLLWGLLLGVIGGAGFMLWWRTRCNSGMRENGESKS
jgi:hypothetical protein